MVVLAQRRHTCKLTPFRMLRLAVPAPKLSCRFLTRMDSVLAMELPNSGRTRVCTLVTLQRLEGVTSG
jgi:hypothetical protein